VTAYRIERRDGLLIVHDPIPVNDLVALVAPMAGGIMCQLCAQALGAVVVVGSREDIAAERERLGIESDAADR
jgi:hypothetical protein